MDPPAVHQQPLSPLHSSDIGSQSSYKPSLPDKVPSISNIKHFVPVELTFLNYLTWKKMFQTFLKSQKCFDLVEGLITRPPSTDSEFDHWTQCDTTVHSWINASLSSSVLETLLNYGCETCHEAWITLEQIFLDHASATHMHLKDKFQIFKKGSISMESYLQQIHSLACSLQAIGKLISDEDLVL
uniref:Retrotransposon Copia-like N-terminal domain-containing protein n=1 Tax=Ananas comosus var. bracteatus TaxID=296719 RepID=A0A6V7NVY2_ANACO|nr:unnamed protein product [Ananas comosus var. bracteatus]